MPKGTYKLLMRLKKCKLFDENFKCDAVKIESNSKNFTIIKGLVKVKYLLWDI